MGPRHLNKFVRRFKRVLSPHTVNQLGRDMQFSHRERVITPYRLALSLLASCAMMRVQSLADIHRCFNALFATTVAYKPFHNQLAKRQFAEFMRELLSMILTHWVVRVLGVQPGGAFSEFGRIVIQDGTSFGVKDTLREHYPGRFKSAGPAAVELHVTMDLLKESVSKVVLTPDTSSERAELPGCEELAGDLLLADRGYIDKSYLRAVHEAGGHFVVRGTRSLNPKVLEAYAGDGTVLERLCNQRLQDVRIPTKGTVDFDVVWGKGEKRFEARMVVSWNRAKQAYRFLVTNLSRGRYTPQQVEQVYRLRWQVE